MMKSSLRCSLILIIFAKKLYRRKLRRMPVLGTSPTFFLIRIRHSRLGNIHQGYLNWNTLTIVKMGEFSKTVISYFPQIQMQIRKMSRNCEKNKFPHCIEKEVIRWGIMPRMDLYECNLKLKSVIRAFKNQFPRWKR